MDADSYTALLMAVINGHFEAVKKLCRMKCVDSNGKSESGKTVLMMAVGYGHIDIVQCLCTIQGVDVNVKDNDGHTALMMAVRNGQIEIVKCLCSVQGVDVNMKDNNGWTALMMAIGNGKIEIAKFICAMQGTDVNVKNNYGWTALMMAPRYGQTEVAKCLCAIQGVDVNMKDNNGWTALMIATRYGHTEIAKLLCTIQGVDVNIKDNNGFTALMEAAKRGHIESVKCLCSIENVDINMKEQSGGTALHLSVRSKHFEVVKYLCSNEDVDINALDNNGKTALLEAIGIGDFETISCLCSNENIDINLKDRKGQNAFLHASLQGYAKCVQYLSSLNGFKVSNPIENLVVGALQGNITTLMESLAKMSVTVSNLLEVLLVIASANGQIECVDYLLFTSVNVNGCKTFPRTPLTLAAMNGHPECVKRLLEKCDVDVNIADKNGRTAFIYAAMNGHAECVKHLLEKCDVDMNIADNKGRTAFMYAAMNGHTECVKCLIFIPTVDIWKVDPEKLTAFHLAIRHGHVSCLPLFVDIREAEADEYSNSEMSNGEEHGILHAFRSRTNFTCTNYRAGIAWKCPSLKDVDFEEKHDIDIVKGNGVAGCTFCFVLAGCKSVEMSGADDVMEREFFYGNNIVKPEPRFDVPRLTNILGLAVRSGLRQSLEYALRYCRLFCHVRDCIKSRISLYQHPNVSLGFDMLNFDFICYRCQILMATDGVKRNNVNNPISEYVVFDCMNNPLDLAVCRKHHKCTRLLIQYVSEHHKTCTTIQHVFLNAANILQELKYVSIFLKNGMFDWRWYTMFPVEKLRYLARELVIHGYSPAHLVKNGELKSPLQHAFSIPDVGLVKYLVANLYLTSSDLKFLQDKMRVNVSQDIPVELQQLHQQLSGQPWSLQALSFLTLSSSLRCKRRNSDMMEDELTKDLHKRLTFTNPIRMLCVKQWDYILSDSVTTDAKTNEWLHDRFLLRDETFVKPEPETLRYGQCCNGKCRAIKPQYIRPAVRDGPAAYTRDRRAASYGSMRKLRSFWRRFFAKYRH